MNKAIKLIHRIPVPTRHPASIAFNQRGIWIADIETRRLILVNPQNGDILENLTAFAPRPQTITWDGEYLWEYDEETFNLFKRRLSDNQCELFGTVDGVTLPYLGMTYREGTLWLISPDQPEFTVSNNIITVIRFPRRIRAETFDAPTYSCRGLCNDGRYLWTLDVDGAEIFAVDPWTGSICTSYRLPECTDPSSIVITEDHVWTLDLKRNELLTFALDRNALYSMSGGRRSHVEIVYAVRNPGPGIIKEYKFYEPLPQNYRNQKLIGDIQIKPATGYEKVSSQWDEGEGHVLLRKICDLAPNNEEGLILTLDIETFNLKYHLYPHHAGTLDDIPETVKTNYLFDELSKNSTYAETVKTAENLFLTKDKEIKNIVEKLVGDEKSTFWIAFKLYNYVVDKIQYVLPYSSVTSKKILEQGKGSCGNHATLYIALCQAAGLPARSIIGYSVWKDDSRLGYLDHMIPEVYMPGYGWIPVDTSRFMSLPIYGKHPLTKFRSFGTLSDRFYVTGFGTDLRSEFARMKYKGELLPVCEGITKPSQRFFIRWDSFPINTEKKGVYHGL